MVSVCLSVRERISGVRNHKFELYCTKNELSAHVACMRQYSSACAFALRFCESTAMGNMDAVVETPLQRLVQTNAPAAW